MTTFSELSRDHSSHFYGYDSMNEIPDDLLQNWLVTDEHQANNHKVPAMRDMYRIRIAREKPLIQAALYSRGLAQVETM